MLLIEANKHKIWHLGSTKWKAYGYIWMLSLKSWLLYMFHYICFMESYFLMMGYWLVIPFIVFISPDFCTSNFFLGFTFSGPTITSISLVVLKQMIDVAFTFMELVLLNEQMIGVAVTCIELAVLTASSCWVCRWCEFVVFVCRCKLWGRWSLEKATTRLYWSYSITTTMWSGLFKLMWKVMLLIFT